MTKLDFAIRAFLKCKRLIKSITDNSANAEVFNIVYEQSLKTFIQDSKGKEFETPLNAKLKYDLTNPANPFYNATTETNEAGQRIFEKSSNIISFGDRPLESVAPQRRSFIGVPIIRGYYNAGIRYFTLYLPDIDEEVIAANSNNLTLNVLYFKSNLNLWSPKALETAICYCGHLMAPEVTKSDDLPMKLEQEYTRKLAEYKIRESVPGSYNSPDSRYDSNLVNVSSQRDFPIPGF